MVEHRKRIEQEERAFARKVREMSGSSVREAVASRRAGAQPERWSQPNLTEATATNPSHQNTSLQSKPPSSMPALYSQRSPCRRANTHLSTKNKPAPTPTMQTSTAQERSDSTQPPLYVHGPNTHRVKNGRLTETKFNMRSVETYADLNTTEGQSIEADHEGAQSADLRVGRDLLVMQARASKQSIFESNLRFSNPASYRTLNLAASGPGCEEESQQTIEAAKRHEFPPRESTASSREPGETQHQRPSTQNLAQHSASREPDMKFEAL